MGLVELASRVNWVDVFILILFVRISYKGLVGGFSGEVIPLLGIFAALMASLHAYAYLGQVIDEFTPFSRTLSNLLSFISLTALILILSTFGQRVLMSIVKVEVVSFLDRIVGTIMGAARAALTISCILIILVFTQNSYIDWSVKERSLLGSNFLKIGPLVYDRIFRNNITSVFTKRLGRE